MGVFDQRDYSYERIPLLDGASKEMDVNGSGTAKNFTYTPSAGEVVYIDKVFFLLQDPGSMDVKDFGSINNGLSNGLLIEYQSVNSVIQLANLEDNGDIATTFSGLWAPTSGDDDGGLGFLDDEDTIVCSYCFPAPIELEGDSSDYFQAVVRDDLRNLSYLRMAVMVRKVLD